MNLKNKLKKKIELFKNKHTKLNLKIKLNDQNSN